MLFDNDIRVAKTQNIEDFTPTMSTYMGAAWDEGFRFTPTNSLLRMETLRRAQVGDKVGFPLSASQARFFDPQKQLDQLNQPTPPKLDQETAIKKVQENQLKLEIPKEGITQEALDILIERKKDELEFRYQTNAAPDGVIPTVSKFSAQIAANLIDPLNIAASFIPIVGQGRYANMLAKAESSIGRAGVRVRVGALEGAVGNALIEPAVYFAAKQEQADYKLMDSVANVLIGGIMGAGLHAGAGAIGDAIKAGRSGRTAEPTGGTAKALAEVDQSTKSAMLRAALAAEGRGYRANVNPVAAMDPKLNPNTRNAIKETTGDSPVRAVDVEELEPAITPDIPAQADVNEGLASGFKETYDIQNSRTADVNSSMLADETVRMGDQEIDLSIQSVTDELNDIAARNQTDIADIITEYQTPVAAAELDAKALEAAVTCRMNF